MWQIVQECDSKASADARSLLIAVLDFEFIFGLSTLMVILPITSRLNSFIQGTSIDIRKVRQNAELAVRTLQGCQDEEQFDLLWERISKLCDEVEVLVESEDIDLNFRTAALPSRRVSRRQQALVG